jgi:hypothetical protein
VNQVSDVYVRDRQTGSVDIVSLGASGANGGAASMLGATHCISVDGRYVVFDSDASNLTPDHVTPLLETHIFRRDRQTGQTLLLDQTPGGQLANGYSYGGCISGDGQFAAFMTHATNLVPDGNGSLKEDVVVCDVATGALELANVSALGQQFQGWAFFPCLSFDGRYVGFDTPSTGLNPLDPIPSFTPDYDVFVRDRVCGLTQLVSVHQPGSSPLAYISTGGDLARDDAHVAFESEAALAANDTNLASDIYLNDWVADLPWKDLGAGLAGTLGTPVLEGEGDWSLAPQGFIGLGRVASGLPVLLVAGTSVLNTPLKGGLLVPAPLMLFPLVTGTGPLVLPANAPPGVPNGTSFYLQCWIADPAGPKGFAASNALGITLRG